MNDSDGANALTLAGRFLAASGETLAGAWRTAYPRETPPPGHHPACPGGAALNRASFEQLLAGLTEQNHHALVRVLRDWAGSGRLRVKPGASAVT